MYKSSVPKWQNWLVRKNEEESTLNTSESQVQMLPKDKDVENPAPNKVTPLTVYQETKLDIDPSVLVSNGKAIEANDELSNDDNAGCFITHVSNVQTQLGEFWKKHGTKIQYGIFAIFLLGYAAYFAYAMYYEFGSESSIRLLWMTMLVVFCAIVKLIKDNFGDTIYEKVLLPIVSFIRHRFTFFKWLFIGAVVLAVAIFIIVEVAVKYPSHLISLVGWILYIALFFMFSANPSKVTWRPVLWGLGLQFVFALLVLRTTFGYTAFEWLGDRVQEFMAYTDEGAKFVFGELDKHKFAFQVLPVVIFFSTVISILYYLGAMQVVILKIAWVMQRTMGTTAAESVNAAGNIFIGQTEAPLLIRPLIHDMTKSELHAVMTGGFATIAGSVMATYILFGVPANHLITASVMAAPCALAMSKLSYPEMEVSRTTGNNVAQMEKPPQQNVIEAASAGASAAIPLVANIAANLIAFIALLAFINTVLEWCGHRVGLYAPDYPELSFQLICSYLLWPFAYVMGVATSDCRQVAELIGTKTFINEFVAFTELGKFIDNTKIWCSYNGSYTRINDDIYLRDINTTLYGGVMKDRSIIISTYALCGFANISSIGMVMGALGAMAENRRSTIASLAVRAMITGTAVSFMNACTAGLLYQPKTDVECLQDDIY